MENLKERLDAPIADGHAFWDTYLTAFKDALDRVEVSDASGQISYGQSLETVQEWLETLKTHNRKILIIGNGGSAGVASHLAVDFWKNGKIKALAFNDSSLLTCVANDYNYEEVFAVPIEQFADEGDLLICISSSGGSANIIKGAEAAKAKGCQVITCSGFKPTNNLRKLGDLNYFVPSEAYGIVESIHQFLIHSFLDVRLTVKDEVNIFRSNKPYNS
ncbi:SIS domain-containing protein [Pontibacter sp. G13]|uniref:SIS domain-containing protein n=1 Tax=Pontibacter sp. G13 TaxID=3074898 RepID=UPI00288B0E15|nr:SIS domain-containing protein [Pontibacter sp. G13]WNJ16128.1 SIS domain-containing protein [Pontibacter sp. G13]